MYALIDCNNFYVSCERAFAPYLNHRPVIVLSNNDGCIVSRSDEAKALGIKMGSPYFKIQAFCKQHGVQVFSSNYALYGDISQRVMTLIKGQELKVEVYSIDEVFVLLEGAAQMNLKHYLENLGQMVLRATGIPVSIGVGATKTLAKIASFQSKKILKKSVCILGQDISVDAALAATPVSEIWGVGSSWAKQLEALKIHTAQDLSLMNANKIRQQYNVILADTVRELQGEACLKLEVLVQAKKNIMSSRSFGSTVRSHRTVAEALSNHAASAAEKLRRQHSLATAVTVFLETSRFKTTVPHYSRAVSLALPIATNDTGLIIKTAQQGLLELYRHGLDYHRTGLRLDGLLPDNVPRQLDLFETPQEQEHHQKKTDSTAAKTMDLINQRFGKNVLFIASQKNHASEIWHLRANYKSPCYTTRWSDLIKAKAGGIKIYSKNP